MSTLTRQTYIRYIFGGLILLLLAFFTFQMYRITVQYMPMEDDIAFLKVKQWVIHLDHWKTNFYVHVFSSIFVLFAGFTQFSPYILQRYPKLHQWAGYVYIGVVVFISAPSGFVLGYYANGGFAAQVSFMILAVLWIGFTCAALVLALQKKLISHGAFMMRSYALTLSAITLRLFKSGFSYAVEYGWMEIGPHELYTAISWLGWVPNLIIAEMLISAGLASRIMKRMKYLKRQQATNAQST